MKRLISILLTAILLIGTVPLSVLATDAVNYIDEDGNAQSCTDYTVYAGETSLSQGWWLVQESVTVETRISITGDCNVILADGATLSANSGIEVSNGNSLTIFAQSDNADSMGSLVSTGTKVSTAGIGGSNGTASGVITINGGIITATGGINAAAIGGGYKAATGSIIINGGIITATGGSYAAAIGGGGADTGSADDVGTGGNITINSGTVTATAGTGAAAIGGGLYGSGGIIIIDGGNITAICDPDYDWAGTGIGGGYKASAGNITINGGRVTATGGYGMWRSAAIGNGPAYFADETGSVNITGGIVTASADNQVQIIGTSQKSSEVMVSITGGMVFQNGNGQIYGDSISLEENFTITDTQSLTVNEGQSLTVEDGVTLYIYGTIVNNGSIINRGIIKGNVSDLTAGSIYDKGIIFWPASQTTDKYDVNGDGAMDTVYEIGNAGQLYWFAGLVNGTLTGQTQNTRANAVLVSDITVNESVLDSNGALVEDTSDLFPWSPINNYYGIFDGQGYDIKGLYCTYSNQTRIGLFKYTHRGSVIRNLGIIDSYFYGYQSVGSIVGQSGSTIYNCHSSSTVEVSAGGSAGGIIGYQMDGSISHCYNTGNVSGYYQMGGIVGHAKTTTITDCYNTGAIKGNQPGYKTHAAGIVGKLNASSTQNCYNTGSVQGNTGYYAQIASLLYSTATTANCYYLSDTETEDGGRTAEQYSSGEMTWILNGESHAGAWTQTLNEDAYPVFDGDTVYYGNLCSTGEYVGYTNEKAYNTEEHYNEDGYCAICGNQPAYLAEDGYYEISNKGQLYWFTNWINRYAYNDQNGMATVNARLTADIVINDVPYDTEDYDFEEWTPIGYDFSHFRYCGIFDGNGHTLSGLYINRDEYHSGFIGVLGEGGIVRNLSITNSYVNGDINVGGIAGYSVSEITNCSVTDSYITGSSYVGSIVGSFANLNDSSASINNSFSAADAVTDGGTECNLGTLIPNNSYYLTSEENDAGGKTEAQFNSGEVAYLLGEGWGQKIGVDSYPVLGGMTVYAGYDCGNTNVCYSNSPLLNEEDSYHIPSEWISAEEEGYHTRYVCTREGCEQSGVTETQPCSGVVATCKSKAYCTTCESYFGEYDATNHTSEATYYSYDDSAETHTLYHSCCNSEIITEAHSFDIHEFNDAEHWLVCECGASEKTVETHSFDEDGFCTVCGGYEPAYLDEESWRYEISKAGQLFWFARSYNSWNTETGDVILTADIDLNPGYTFASDGSYYADDSAGELRSWTPIGMGYVSYTGTFDGQDHTVSGLYINDPDADMAGLFGTTGYNYPISNITLINGYVRANSYAGALIAYAESEITNCHSDLTVVSSGFSGGIAAYLTGGGIYESSVSGEVSIYQRSSASGGIVGNIYYGEIVNCINYATVKGIIYTGGIAGDINGNRVVNCLHLGNVESGHSGTRYSIAESYENSYCYASKSNDNGGVTAAQLASGEITYLLQSAQSEEDVYDDDWNYIGTYTPTVWTQTIGTDEYPTLNATGDIVYRNIVNGCCEENYVYEYSNTEEEPVIGHIYENGVCACGTAQPSDGQQVVIGDYTYTYYTDHATGAPEGWNAVVNDKTLSSYGAIEAEVNGLPVTQLYKTFAGCTNMTEAPAIPEGVKVLYNTFKNCTALTSAPAIPEGVENMTYAFWGCSSLTEAPELPESVKILKGAFYKCTALTAAPELIGIEDLTQAFDGCTNLTGEVTLATDNAEKAFRGTNVTSVKITKDVTEIAQGTFDGCNITDITYEGTGAEFAALTIGSYNGSFRKASVKVTLADTPSIVSDGKRTYICDLENIKDLYIGKGTHSTYREVKNNLYYGMTSAKLGDSNIYTYGAVLPAGEYTLYVRYIDGSHDCVNFTVE